MNSNKESIDSILDGFGDRLSEVIQDQGMTAYQVAKDLGHKRADTVYNILNKRQYANLKLVVELLLLFPEVNANWFVLGKGPKYIEDLDDLLQEQANHAQRKKYQQVLIQSIRSAVDDLEKNFVTASDESKQ